MRTKVVAGNWKLNKTIAEAIDFITLLKRSEVINGDAEVVLCPVFTALADAAEAAKESPIAIGAQDLYWEESGAFTGEVSSSLIKDTGSTYVIIGHSERRQFFGETDQTVNNKLNAAYKGGLTPIVCCGELLEERESGKTEQVLETQITGAYQGVDADVAAKTIIAYEPVWAIGTGKVATSEQAQEAHAFIRGLLAKLYSQDVADQIRILYGGSVKPDNAGELMSNPDVDGALVGGASLKADSFGEIISKANEVAVS